MVMMVVVRNAVDPKRLNPATQGCNGGESQWRGQAFRRRKPAFVVKDEKLFPGESELPNRACPTTGSDRGSLRDHDLTLIVRPHLAQLHSFAIF